MGNKENVQKFDKDTLIELCTRFSLDIDKSLLCSSKNKILSLLTYIASLEKSCADSQKEKLNFLSAAVLLRKEARELNKKLSDMINFMEKGTYLDGIKTIGKMPEGNIKKFIDRREGWIVGSIYNKLINK